MGAESRPPVPDWLVTMPKVELHVHLEGTIGPATLWRLAQQNGVDLGVRNEDGVTELFRFRDFADFIDTFTVCSDCLRSADDLGLVAESYGDELARQHVRYAELHFNPEPNERRRGIAMDDALAAMNAARERLRLRHGIELRWIADGVRDADSGPASVERTVDWMIKVGHDSGIVALGLGGNEVGRPPGIHAAAFERARRAGFHLVAHAGEAAGPDSIWEALGTLHAERIGHGIAAVHDPALLAYLTGERIPLEICLSSNLQTGGVASIHEHPLPALYGAGVSVSLSSDEPLLFGTDLLTEYALAREMLDLDRQGMARLVLGAIEQSFADPATRDRLRRELLEHTPLNEISATPEEKLPPTAEGSAPGHRSP